MKNNDPFFADVENFEPHDFKSTLPAIYHPLMQAPTMVAGRCFICGRREPLEQHHYVWRSWGKLYKSGVEMRKPTITLCGFGNNLRDANGRYYCHGLAHHRMLHFRWKPSGQRTEQAHSFTAYGAGRLQYLLTEEPTDYEKALEMEGWQNVSLLENGGIF